MPGPVSTFKPFQSYEIEAVPAIRPEALLESGKYQLKFILYSPDGGRKSLESNMIEITIESPQGINKQAFDFLNKHGKDLWFSGILQEKNGASLLKTFVERYGENVYGEYAINTLGNYHRSRAEFDKAQIEFEKLKSSENKFLTRDALNPNQ